MPQKAVMRATTAKQDNFFLWAMVLLPIASSCAYVFDAFYFYYYSDKPGQSTYEGLLSTIVSVFSYLQYCAPIESKCLLIVYHLLLWILVEAGHIGHLLAFIQMKNLFSAVIFLGWIFLDVMFTLSLLYCRVYRRLDLHIEVENKHIFHFISRLEIILAIFIPIFVSQEFTTISRDNIAFFLLFDFFSEGYEHFQGVWIKSCLYLFVTAVTASVGCEWMYFHLKQHTFEYIVDVSELVAACLCSILIIMQFFPFHFKPRNLHGVVQQVRSFVTERKKQQQQRNNSADDVFYLNYF